MKKKMVRIFIFMFAVALVFPMTSFGKNDVPKPKEIKAMLDDIIKPQDGQDQFAKEYERFTGIKLNIIQPPHQQYMEKMNLAFAAGDVPDVVEIAAQDYMNYALRGAFVPLDNYIRSSQIMKKIDPKILNSVRVGGKIYGIPMDTGGGCVTYIRKDWLDKLGLKVPTTFDELINVMRAFTLKDPDGNGKNDTIGYTAPGVSDDMYLRDFLQNATMGFTVKNGNWVDGYVQPEFKSAMERLRKAYAEGIIDKEIFTNKTSTCTDKFYAGKVGIFTYWASTRAIEIDDSVKHGPSGPSAVVIPIPAIRGSHYDNRVPVVHAISAKAKDPESIFKWFLEYEHDSAQGQMLFAHGVEGVHYTNKDGIFKVLPSLSNPKTVVLKSYLHWDYPVTAWKDPITVDPRIATAIKVFQGSAVMQRLAPDSKTLVNITADLQALRQEVVSKILIGEYSVDDGLATYKKQSQKLGIDQVLKEMNTK